MYRLFTANSVLADSYYRGSILTTQCRHPVHPSSRWSSTESCSFCRSIVIFRALTSSSRAKEEFKSQLRTIKSGVEQTSFKVSVYLRFVVHEETYFIFSLFFSFIYFSSLETFYSQLINDTINEVPIFL